MGGQMVACMAVVGRAVAAVATAETGAQAEVGHRQFRRRTSSTKCSDERPPSGMCCSAQAQRQSTSNLLFYQPTLTQNFFEVGPTTRSQ